MQALGNLRANKKQRSNACWAPFRMNAHRVMYAALAPPLHYRDFALRLATLEDVFLSDDYKRNLAASGIYHDGADGYKCAYCSLYLRKLNAHDLKYHTFSVCPMATQRLLDNVTLRKESFRKFKAARLRYRNDAEALAKNGFYYYGTKLEIRCAFCHVVIVKLGKNDNAQAIHRKYTPECVFNEPSAPAQDDYYLSPSTPSSSSYSHATERIYPELPAVADVTAAEYKWKVVTDNEWAPSAPPVDDPVAADSASDDIMCKICFERERRICFLPCRHVSTCEECARRCKVCCICRERVKQRLEIFLQ
ncbi:iap-2 [Peridroma alphabaculovirus]|uniref:Iap-2 n=1 Tax=Peridroma alphabaculovirus TaxID=1346829 RepID=A0A068LKI0_9ABAC|nr:iap-2 [Peridroma alphabaculovirus]AIE47792.1 iap-2 [Peridroma alphabaculovirus]